MSGVKSPHSSSKLGHLPSKSYASEQDRRIPRSAEDSDLVERPRGATRPGPPTLMEALDLASSPPKAPPTPNNRLDWVSAKQWLDMQSDKGLPAAKAILRNITRISQDHFDNVFADGVQDMVRHKPAGRALLALQQLVFGRDGKQLTKSNHWMTERARQLAPGLLEGDLHVSGFSGDHSPYLAATYSNKLVDLVLFDDAGYSGDQASELIKSAIDTAKYSGATLGTIFVVLGCITQRAREKILTSAEGHSTDGPNIAILGRPIHMPTVSELVANGEMSAADLAMLQKRIPELQATRRKPHPEEELTLTYLSHKVPDEKSALHSILAQGVGIDHRKGGDPQKFLDGIPFIPQTVPPYKKKE